MLKIKQTDHASVRRHGEETYPNECCGVLLGRVADDGTRIVTSIARRDAGTARFSQPSVILSRRTPISRNRKSPETPCQSRVLRKIPRGSAPNPVTALWTSCTRLKTNAINWHGFC